MKWILLLALFMAPSLALAQNEQSQQSTRIEVDSKNQVIRMIIKDEEVARFTENGLLMTGDIVYGGIIRDGGLELTEDESSTGDTEEGGYDSP